MAREHILKHRWTVAVIAILVLLFTVVVVGCGEDEETTTSVGPTDTTAAPTDTTAAPTTGAFKVGVNAPYTGINAGAWPGTYNALKVEIERVNAEGGVNGRLIEMVELDTKSDPTTAANNATNLCTRDDIAACFMTYPPEEIAAIAPIVEKYKMPSITWASPLNMEGQSELWKGEWLFYVMASGEDYTNSILNEIKAQGWTSVLGIADQILLNIEILDLLEERAGSEGLSVTVMPDQVSLAETDLTPYCNKIYAEWKKNPTDVVFLMNAMTQFPQLYKGLRGLGLDVPIVGGPVCAHVASFAMGPEAVEGALIVGNAATNAPALPDDYRNKAMMVEYDALIKEKMEAPLDMWGAQAIDGCQVLWEGLKAGGDDHAATRDAIEALKDFPSCQGGMINYMPGDHKGISGGWVTWEMTNGEFKFVRALD
ncbi:MAG: ABC transporter substrate-binding protein [Thermoleophilia bacterium]|nr:ABC transporter substrate-binding protein [Thermoleophilia bacterium]